MRIEAILGLDEQREVVIAWSGNPPAPGTLLALGGKFWRVTETAINLDRPDAATCTVQVVRRHNKP